MKNLLLSVGLVFFLGSCAHGEKKACCKAKAETECAACVKNECKDKEKCAAKKAKACDKCKTEECHGGEKCKAKK